MLTPIIHTLDIVAPNSIPNSNISTATCSDKRCCHSFGWCLGW